MYRTYRIKLKPTKEQEEKLFHSANVARYTYNWALNEQNEEYKTKGGTVSAYKLINKFNKYKKEEGNEWLTKPSSKVPTRAIMDLEEAFELFFKGASKYPRFHSYRKTKPSFYVRSDSIKVTNNKIKLEKIGYVKKGKTTVMDFDKKFYNCHCKYNGKDWYLTLNYEVTPKENNAQQQPKTIGIDMGVSNLATTSEGKHYSNINKSKEVKRLIKKKNRLSRSQNRKYKMNNKPDEFKKTQNIKKTEQEIVNIFIRIRNIRRNYIHHVVKDILSDKPTRVVVEGLNISGLIKNKYLGEDIATSLWGYFMKHLESKCEEYGIEFVEADRFYPSSKLCSNCGYKKEDLPLSVRTYNCENCGDTIDRDMNAAINLKNYTEE